MADISAAITAYRESKANITHEFKEPTKPRPPVTAKEYEDSAPLKSLQRNIGYYFEACVMAGLDDTTGMTVNHETAQNFFDAVANSNLNITNSKGAEIQSNAKLQEIKLGIETAAADGVKNYLKSLGVPIDSQVTAAFTENSDVRGDIIVGENVLELKYTNDPKIAFSTLTDARLFNYGFFNYLVSNNRVYWTHREKTQTWTARLKSGAFRDFMTTNYPDGASLTNLLLTKGGSAPIDNKKILIGFKETKIGNSMATSMEIDLDSLYTNLTADEQLQASFDAASNKYQVLAQGLKTPIMTLEIAGMQRAKGEKSVATGDGKIMSLRDFSFQTYIYHKQIANRGLL